MTIPAPVLKRCFLAIACTLVAASAVLAASPSPGLLQFMSERQSLRYSSVPREVLAFYYTWYGRPERQGHWVHWGGENTSAHDIPESTHYPAQGAYDSHDPEVIDRHIDLARQHGLTGFIATWWGQKTYDDRAFATLLARANEKRFKVTVYWETAPGKGQSQIDRAVADLVYVLDRYGSAEAFLKVDGKPVIFVYGRVMDEVPLASWPAIIEQARQKCGRDFVLIADGYSEAYVRLFDGVHTYNICGWVQGKKADELRQASAAAFADAVRLARSHGKISCLTVIPGYDDTKIRKPGINAERYDGQTYRILWEQALAANPDWVLITSWNEWHEGSEIEPSWEHGDQYLKLTTGYAERFRATQARQSTTAVEPAGLDPQRASLLRRLYRGKTIGVLPDYASQAVFWLADAGIELEELSWQQLLDSEVLDPARLPMLIYAGGEHYVRTVHSDGDVEAALTRYLSRGGMLIACSYQPYPFFYDETGRPNIAAGRLGLPINGSGPVRQPDKYDARTVRAWETPPPDADLAFRVDSRRLPGVPETMAFPVSGDLRWRPATEALAAPGDRYLPLATLHDAAGRSYGDGISYIEHRASQPQGGRSLYVWMRMPELLGANETFFSLFRLAAAASEGAID